jgi:hypothetical protein
VAVHARLVALHWNNIQGWFFFAENGVGTWVGMTCACSIIRKCSSLINCYDRTSAVLNYYY